MKKRIYLFILILLLSIIFLLFNCNLKNEEKKEKETDNKIKYYPPFKTGQTLKADDGDDGDLQAGVNWPDPRFTVNPDNTITDNLTGLIWEKDLTTDEKNWENAFLYAENLELGGYKDWRIPNVDELASLLNYNTDIKTYNYLNGSGFSNCQHGWYWSSTTNPIETNEVFIILFGNDIFYSRLKTSAAQYIIAVRGTASNIPKTGQTLSYRSGDDGDLQFGITFPDPRFTDNGNGTVTDNLTGLTWEKSPGSVKKSWNDALTYASTLELGEYTDWRLANINELLSLMNRGQSNSYTWLNLSGFSGVSFEDYWSSTSYIINSYAYDMNFSSGCPDYDEYSTKKLSWCVR